MFEDIVIDELVQVKRRDNKKNAPDSNDSSGKRRNEDSDQESSDL